MTLGIRIVIVIVILILGFLVYLKVIIIIGFVIHDPCHCQGLLVCSAHLFTNIAANFIFPAPFELQKFRAHNSAVIAWVAQRESHGWRRGHQIRECLF